MKSAIDELILDNSNFMDNIKTSEIYRNLSGDNDKIYKKLKEMLTDEQLKLLEELINNDMGMEAHATECYLIHGFKTAIKLMLECLI